MSTDADTSEQESAPRVKAPTKRTGKVKRKGVKTSTPITINKWVRRGRKEHEKEVNVGESTSEDLVILEKKESSEELNVSRGLNTEEKEESRSEPDIFD